MNPANPLAKFFAALAPFARELVGLRPVARRVPANVAEIEAAVCAKVAVSLANRRGRKPRAGKLVCWYCDEPIVGLDGALELADVEIPDGISALDRRCVNAAKRAIAFPGNGPELVRSGRWKDCESLAFVAHYDCNPRSLAYWIGFDRIGEDWEEHLSHKRWHSLAYDAGVEMVRKALDVKRPRERHTR